MPAQVGGLVFGGGVAGTGAMKRPQRRSRPRRRTVLSATGAVDGSELARMETMATYRPSPYHKFGSSAAGLQSAPAPRPDKTICDRPTSGRGRNALDLLRSGFRRGMVSEQRRGDWPQNVWAVDEEGVVYEAQLGNLEAGEYHGYPMKQDDSFAGFIRDEWKRRGT